MRCVALALCAIVALPSPVALAIGVGISPECEQGMKLWLGERCLAVDHAPLDSATRDAVEQMWASACGAPESPSPALLARDSETAAAVRQLDEEIRIAQRDGRPDTAQHLCCVSVHRLLLMTGGPWAPSESAGSTPVEPAMPLDAAVPVAPPAATVADDPPPPRSS